MGRRILHHPMVKFPAPGHPLPRAACGYDEQRSLWLTVAAPKEREVRLPRRRRSLYRFSRFRKGKAFPLIVPAKPDSRESIAGFLRANIPISKIRQKIVESQVIAISYNKTIYWSESL